MAHAVVNLRISPLELQIVDEALRMLRHVAMYTCQDAADPLENFTPNWGLTSNDPRKLSLQCEALRRDIGLKSDSSRKPKNPLI